MNLRYIDLSVDYSSYDDVFFNIFTDNVFFVSHFLSRRIRAFKIPTDGSFNMLSVCLTKSGDSCQIVSEKCLITKMNFSEENLKSYLNMHDEKQRFEHYLSLLEKGYNLASKFKAIPIDILLNLHTEFRNNNYKNEWLFKKKTVKEYGLKIVLKHVLTSYDYKLMLSLYDTKNQFVNDGCIYQTFPDSILFDKNVRHLVIEYGKLIITDFLDHPQFVCELSDLSKGIIKSECVDENTRKYIPNEKNREKFERLKW